MNKYFYVLTLIIFLSSFSTAQKQWIRCSNGLPVDTGVLSLAKIGNVLFAGTEKAGVYKSIDGGNNWQAMPFHSALRNSQTWSMTTLDTFLFAGQRGGGILRTTLNGMSWEVKNNGITKRIIQDIITINQTLYAASYGGGVYVSYDTAKTWSVLYDNSGMDDSKVYSLANNNSFLFAGTAGVNTTMPDTGVAFVTSLNGNSWQLINNGFIRNGAHLESVFSLAANDSLVFAGTDDVGIFRSTNNGQLWEQTINTNVNGDVHSIAIYGNQVFYGTTYGGVFSSDDYGKSFAPNNIGLSYKNTTLPFLVKDLLIFGDTIYAATDIGVFKQSIHTLTNQQSFLYPSPETIQLIPNPCTGNCLLECYIQTPNRCKIQINNVVNPDICFYSEQHLYNGLQQIHLNLQNYPSGIYSVRLWESNKYHHCNFILCK